MVHDKYEENLQAGKAFEDFVSHKLYEAGIPIGVHQSRSYQSKYGESKAGFEIKYDRNSHKTGNLFIETSERHSVEQEKSKPSGIYGHGWLLVIGDYHKLWILDFTTLCRLNESGEYPMATRKDPSSGVVTAGGFLLPVADADKYAARIFDFSPGGKSSEPADDDKPHKPTGGGELFDK